MRGKGRADQKVQRGHRITPAYAGKRSPSRPTAFCVQDHPRVCGEKQKKSPTGLVTRGSPPRMRGKVLGASKGCDGVGITPAYAGKRARPKTPPLTPRDHPRMCGEKGVYALLYTGLWGSPPRMRGKGQNRRSDVAAAGITPAYAGKRLLICQGIKQSKDHPRVCGEKTKKIP